MALPYIQLYVADYLADTAHLTGPEHGAYLLLILNYWQRAKPLPKCQKRLASIARTEQAEFDRIWESTLREFFIEFDDCWRHKRIDRDLEVMEEKSRKNSDAAKSRYANAVRTQCERSANAVPDQKQTQNDRIATTETDAERSHCHKEQDKDKDQDQDKREKKEYKEKKVAIVEPDGSTSPGTEIVEFEKSIIKKPSDPGYSEAFEAFWAAYPRKSGKGAAWIAWKKLRPDQGLMRSMAEALKSQKNSIGWLKDGGQFIPMPATWLNQRRWEDQPESPIPFVAGEALNREMEKRRREEVEEEASRQDEIARAARLAEKEKVRLEKIAAERQAERDKIWKRREAAMVENGRSIEYIAEKKAEWDSQA